MNIEKPALSPRPPTLRNVADAAGVSVATASRVLSGNYPITDATRRRVESAIEELGYDVSRARAPRVPATRMIAAIVPDIRPPLISGIIDGIEHATTASGRLTLIATTHRDEDREADAIRMLASQSGLDAVILIGGFTIDDGWEDHIAHYARSLRAADAVLVLCGRSVTLPSGQEAYTVSYDNSGGTFAATSLLIARGHRSIAWVGGSAGYSTSLERLDGFRRALNDFGLTEDPSLVRIAAIERTGLTQPSYQLTLELIDSGHEFTAIVAQNDIDAAEVIQALWARGLRVPEDVSVVGFDDIPLAQTLTPPLTTIRLPHAELGQEAVRLALERPAFGSGPDRVMLGTHPVLRDSVAAPRTTAR